MILRHLKVGDVFKLVNNPYNTGDSYRKTELRAYGNSEVIIKGLGTFPANFDEDQEVELVTNEESVS